MDAAEYLFELGARAAPALPDLIIGLTDSERLVVYHCAKALGRIGPRAVGAIPRLLEILKDPHADTNDRSAAAEGLAGIGHEAIPALSEALIDSDSLVRQEAAHALGRCGPGAIAAVTQLISVLNDPVEMVRYNATEALGNIGPPTIPALTDALSNADPLTRVQAGRALLKLKPNSRPAIDAMAAALKADDRLVRFGAAVALEQVGDEAAPVISQMIEALRTDDYEFVRSTIACALGEMNLPASIAKPVFLASMNDPCSGVRQWSASALGRIRPVSVEAIKALSRTLEHDPDQLVRNASVRSLGEFGAPARSTLPLLRRLLETQDDAEFREELEEAIWLIQNAPES